MTTTTTITATAPDTPLPTIPKRLLPHHLAELRRSGLSDATITAAGIYSEVDHLQLAAALNWRGGTKRLVPAIVFPFCGASGANGYMRAKPDRPRVSGGKPVKYESPKGQPNRIYLPPGVAQRLEDSTVPIVLTEGEKKALKAAQEELCCVGLVGVFAWKEKHREALLAELERIAWKGRLVYIIFDSDAAEKLDVKDAEARLAAQLVNRGATVKVVRLPQGPAGEDGKLVKVGLDDFLVAHGEAELHKLLNSAEEPEAPDPAQMKIDAKNADAAVAASRFLELCMVDGLPRIRFWRGAFHLWAAGAYRSLQTAEVQAKVVHVLNQTYRRITGHVVADTMMQLRAQSLLAGSNEPPAWLDEPPVFSDDKSYWPSEGVLTAKNGLVCLPRLVEGKEHTAPLTPRLFVESALDYEFSIDAPPPACWLEFLGQLWPGDPESIATLQEWFGYCLTPDTSQQKILMVVGPKRSGKGTIARVLRQMIGKANVCGPTLAGLATNFGLWPLLGKPLGIISDARLGGRTDSQIVVERLLSISGEDALTIDRKNLEPITAKLPTRLMILSNELPRLGDSSGALAGRMVVLRLRESFYGREDHTLTQRLLGELPGFLLWSIEGWRRLNERGRFVQPQAAGELVDELADLSSPIAAFLRECCHIGPEHEVPRADLYTRYAEWCQAKGQRYVADERGFGRDLRAALPVLADRQHRLQGAPVRFYGGVGLRPETL